MNAKIKTTTKMLEKMQSLNYNHNCCKLQIDDDDDDDAAETEFFN